MEKLIKGSEVADSDEGGGKTAFAEFFMAVKKGHGECGDSAFVYSDAEKVVAAVFDGVSGEPGASFASSDAAEAALEYLKGLASAGDKEMQEALSRAHLNIKLGSTTAALLFLSRDGSFVIAGIGDSPIYGISKGEVSLELPLARAVGDGDSILKFFYFRNIVTAVLGGPADSLDVGIRKGKLKKGEVLILASDGLSDNLFIKVDGGFIAESSGKEDLEGLIAKRRGPRELVKLLMGEIARRLEAGKTERKGGVLVPKEDDIAIVALRKL
ncbi:MAG: protein phosphatase 2C domain-containing protein [Candidatus Micrarchaeota archaeon]